MLRLKQQHHVKTEFKVNHKLKREYKPLLDNKNFLKEIFLNVGIDKENFGLGDTIIISKSVFEKVKKVNEKS